MYTTEQVEMAVETVPEHIYVPKKAWVFDANIVTMTAWCIKGALSAVTLGDAYNDCQIEEAK